MDLVDTYRAAQAHLAAGDPAAALPLLRSAVEQAPGEVGLLRLLALARFSTGDPAGAMAILRELVVTHPLDADLHAMLGDSLSQCGLEAQAAHHRTLAGQLQPAYSARCDVWSGTAT